MTRSEAWHYITQAVNSLHNTEFPSTAEWGSRGIAALMDTAPQSDDRDRFDRYVCAVAAGAGANAQIIATSRNIVDVAAELYAAANAKWESMNNEAKGEQP